MDSDRRIEVRDARGRALAPWEVERLVGELVEQAQRRMLTDLEQTVRRAISETITRLRGRVD